MLYRILRSSPSFLHTTCLVTLTVVHANPAAPRFLNATSNLFRVSQPSQADSLETTSTGAFSSPASASSSFGSKITEILTSTSIDPSSTSSDGRSWTVITYTDPAPSTTLYPILTLPFETHTITESYPYIGTTLTETVTGVYNPNTQTHLNADACYYYGYACPVYTTSLEPVRSSLKSANDAACLRQHDYTQTMGFAGAPTACCGTCSLIFLKVDVFYFPPPNATCLGPSHDKAMTTADPHVTPRALEGRAHSLGSGSSAIVNGHTFISPSIYVGFSSIYAQNECGLVGDLYTDFTLAFAPGELSTAWAPFPGWPAMTTGAFDPASISCTGRPVIVPPPQLLTRDPAWVGCRPDRFNGVDPPYALTPAADAPSPFSATITPPALPTKSPASPSSVVASPPQSTAAGHAKPTSKVVDPKSSASVDMPSPIPSSSSIDPISSLTKPGIGPSLGDVSSSNPDSPPAILPFSTLASPAATLMSTLDYPGSVITPAPIIIPAALTTTYGGEAHTIAILSLKEPSLSHGPNPIPKSGLVALILSGFNLDPSSPPPSPITNLPDLPAVSSFPESIITVAGQIATLLDSSRLLVSGSTILLGVSPITIGGETLSLSLGDLLATRTDRLATPSILYPMTVPIPAGLLPNQPVLLEPSNAVVVDGTTLFPGGATITIDGKLLHVESSFLVVGSSTIPLQPIGAAAQSTVFDIGIGTSVASAVPTLLALPDGEVLTLGGPTLTVSGTEIYYGTNGLVIGKDTIAVSGSGMGLEMSATGSGLGGVIASGVEGMTRSSLTGSGGPTQSILAFEGMASGRKPPFSLVALGIGVLMGFL